MRTRPFTSGRVVSELALGTWGLSGDGYGAVSEAVQDEVISRARAYGVTLFETADVYGRGSMEERLGRLLGADQSVCFVTKVGTDLSAIPARKRFEPEYLRECCRKSSERLQRGCLDVLLLHNPGAPTLERPEVIDTLTELKAQGKLAAWGVSAGSADVARAALAHGAEVLELAYNLFSSMDLESLDFAGRQVAVLARSVLSYGLLCGQWADNKVFPSSDHRAERWTTEQLRSRLRQLSVVSGMLGGEVLTLRSAALRFVLANPVVSSAVIGPRNRVQLDQLVREAGNGPEYLPAGVAERAREQLARMGANR
jgi:aryl-alcohol dehydrogenase-like predicted oxidoreductase